MGIFYRTTACDLTAIERPSMHVDEIISACGLPASVVLAELTILQISGAVTQEQGKRFTRNIAEKTVI